LTESPKGRDAYVVKNVIQLMLASNNEWVAPESLGRAALLCR